MSCFDGVTLLERCAPTCLEAEAPLSWELFAAFVGDTTANLPFVFALLFALLDDASAGDEPAAVGLAAGCSNDSNDERVMA